MYLAHFKKTIGAFDEVSDTQKSAFEEKEVGRRPGFSCDKNWKRKLLVACKKNGIAAERGHFDQEWTTFSREAAVSLLSWYSSDKSASMLSWTHDVSNHSSLEKQKA